MLVLRLLVPFCAQTSGVLVVLYGRLSEKRLQRSHQKGHLSLAAIPCVHSIGVSHVDTN